MTVVITGWNSQIAVEFRQLAPADETFMRAQAGDSSFGGGDRYLLCHGLLWPKSAREQTENEVRESWEVNCYSVIRLCTQVFASNPAARICIIGSESGYRGSFDESYARSKDAVHRFVETHSIGAGQQLVAISPWIIEDCGMTTSRTDIANLGRRRIAHPMQRFLKAREVARLALHLLYEQAFISGTVIRMHGGLR